MTALHATSRTLIAFFAAIALMFVVLAAFSATSNNQAGSTWNSRTSAGSTWNLGTTVAGSTSTNGSTWN